MHECADLGRTVRYRFLEMEKYARLPKSRARIPFPTGRSHLGCNVRSILADRWRRRHDVVAEEMEECGFHELFSPCLNALQCLIG